MYTNVGVDDGGNLPPEVLAKLATASVVNPLVSRSAVYDDMQARIVSGIATGLPVVFPEGTFVLDKIAAGALKVTPNSKPLTIYGQGQGRTTFVLSKNCPRFLDFDPQGVTSSTFSRITLGRCTIDANNLNHLSLAPLTSITTAASIPATFAWTTISLSSNAAFQTGVEYVWFPASNAGTAQGVTLSARPVSGSTTDIQVSGGVACTVQVNDQLSGAMPSEGVIGNRHLDKLTKASSGTDLLLKFDQIAFEDIDIINVPATPVASLTAPSPCLRWGIALSLTGAGSTATNITYKRVTVNGADCGIATFGKNGTFMDNIVHEDCAHDRGSVSTLNYGSLNFLVGQNAWVGRVAFRGRCYGRYSGDVGIEVDQPMMLEIGPEVLIEDATSANYYVTNFVEPARSLAGPPTTTLSAALDASSTTVTVGTIPSGIDGTGYARIDSEIVNYKINSTTTMTILRGFNGSTAATHASGATVTFIEHTRQMVRIAGRSRRLLSTTVRGMAMFTNSFLPLPGIIASGSHERTNDTGIQGEAIYLAGLPASLDMLNFTVRCGGNTGQSVSLVYVSRQGVVVNTSFLHARPTPVRGTFDFQVGGVASAGALNFVALDAGWWDLDLDGRIYNGLKGLSANTRGIWSGAVANVVRGRVKLTVGSSDQADGAMTVCSFANNTNLQRMELDLDLTQMNVAVNAGFTNYVPYTASGGLVFIRKLIHPTALGVKLPRAPKKIASVTAAYTATHDDDVVTVNSSSAAITVTLPILTAGNSTVTPKPTLGAEITIVDIAGSAATNNITVTPASGETINGSTASKTIATNLGSIHLLGTTASGWSVV